MFDPEAEEEGREKERKYDNPFR